MNENQRQVGVNVSSGGSVFLAPRPVWGCVAALICTMAPAWLVAGHGGPEVYALISFVFIVAVTMCLFGYGRAFLQVLAREWVLLPTAALLALLLVQLSHANEDGLINCVNWLEQLQLINWLAWGIGTYVITRAVCVLGVSPTAIARGIILVGVALLVMGIVQAFTHAGMYGLVSFDRVTFATFTYCNNAGTYFGMLALMSLAVVPGWQGIGLGLLFGVGVYLSTCRAAILLLVFMFVWSLFSKLRKPGIWLLSVTLLGLSVVAYEFVIGSVSTDVAHQIADRTWEQAVNLRIIRDYLWFGVGGWGGRYYPACYLPATEHWRILSQPNTHCDYIVAVMEVGIVGACFLFVMFGVVLLRLLAAKPALSVSWWCVLLFPCVHALIDCPFRCPAVVCLLLSVCALLSIAGPSGVCPTGRLGRGEFFRASCVRSWLLLFTGVRRG